MKLSVGFFLLKERRVVDKLSPSSLVGLEQERSCTAFIRSDMYFHTLLSGNACVVEWVEAVGCQ